MTLIRTRRLCIRYSPVKKENMALASIKTGDATGFTLMSFFRLLQPAPWIRVQVGIEPAQ